MEALAASDGAFAPILVHWPGMRVIDGVHRLMAARSRGARTVLCSFFTGDEEDAFALAVSENNAHGLPLSLADRKLAARRILQSFPHWSARRVAATTGISAGTVAGIRRDLGEPASGSSRVGRDGKVRRTDQVERRGVARQLILDHPELSLRQIATRAGISPETVRTLKNNLLNASVRPLDHVDPPERQGTSSTRLDEPSGPRPGPPENAGRVAALRDRLRADPALRLRETGRELLRLLNLTSISPEEWDRLVAVVPPAHRAAVVQLARACGARWAELARLAAHDPNSVQVRGFDSWTGVR